MEAITLTTEMMMVLGLLAFTIFLFVSEIVKIDVAAVLVMVILGLLALVPGLETLVDPKHLFDGFASNAVISIIAVMIIGAGLDKTGIMSQVASFILNIGGRTEQRVIPIVSGVVGIISSFMQNVGAAALFLPVMSRISARTGLPMSRLLMPMGFCAILGGTITLVGSSPLILLNDLLPDGMEKFGLFDVTPVGLALMIAGIAYFVIAGRWVLPSHEVGQEAEGATAYFQRVYGLDYDVVEMHAPAGISILGKEISNIEQTCGVRIIGARHGDELWLSPQADFTIEAGMDLAVLGSEEGLEKFIDKSGIERRDGLIAFADALTPTQSGVSELVVPVDSDWIGKTPRDLGMRRHLGLSLLARHRRGETFTEGLYTTPIWAGDTLVVHGRWRDLTRVEKTSNTAIVTQDYPRDESRPHKITPALIFFTIALGLVLFSDLRLSVSLLVGAVGMVLAGVLSMDEAYKAVSWKTVFLLASLIPLGAAVENSGTAAWIAQNTLALLGDIPAWGLQLTIAVLATVFSLVMSNVGATVLLVPLSVNIALAAQASGIDADPRIFALTVAIATSNAFIIPTHQVNALIMGPGGYAVKDYIKAGGIMTVLFIVVMMLALNLLY